jgi:hypothetical protein
MSRHRDRVTNPTPWPAAQAEGIGAGFDGIVEVTEGAT